MCVPFFCKSFGVSNFHSKSSLEVDLHVHAMDLGSLMLHWRPQAEQPFGVPIYFSDNKVNKAIW